MFYQVQDCAPLGLCDSKEHRCYRLHSLCHYDANISLDCAGFKMATIHAVVERKKQVRPFGSVGDTFDGILKVNIKCVIIIPCIVLAQSV